MDYPDRCTYIGPFKDGKKHGDGTENFPNRDYYVGGFQNGKRHGQGKKIGFNGKGEEIVIYDGKWEKGVKVDTASEQDQ